MHNTIMLLYIILEITRHISVALCLSVSSATNAAAAFKYHR